MRPFGSLKTVVEELYPLHRALVSDGTDQALALAGAYLPAESYSIETFAPGLPVWTWRVPERFLVHAAYLETEAGERLVDFHANPLHLLSYSLPIDAVLTWDELAPHLYTNPARPHAIPWEFKYYERNWGFCLSQNQYDRLPREGRYHAVIRVDFDSTPANGLRVGLATLGTGDRNELGEFLLCAHICHPNQANDDAAGVVTALAVMQRLSLNPLPPGSMPVRLLLCPETIGSITYLSQHEDLIPAMRGGLFCEMTGSANSLALQRTRQDTHLLDRIARAVLQQRGREFREGAFRTIVANDEMVINGPGVNVPCLSLSRWPYPEYHTSDDNPSIIEEAQLVEAADVAEAIVRIFASNYVPVRTFKGPVFLSGFGLWVDWRINRPLNRAIEQIMLRFEGQHTIFDIAQELGLDYWDTRAYVERFRELGLVLAQPIPQAG